MGFTPLVYLVRHGSTKLNNSTGSSVERLRGWQDIQLDETGKQDAKNTAAYFKGVPVGKIVSSDFSRAHDTAKEIGKVVGKPVTTSENLRPWKLGEMEGKPVKDVLDQMKSFQKEENQNKPVPGGESWANFKSRYLPMLDEEIRTAKPSAPTVLVAHHRNAALAQNAISEGKVNHNVESGKLTKGDIGCGDVLAIGKEDGGSLGYKVIHP